MSSIIANKHDSYICLFMLYLVMQSTGLKHKYLQACQDRRATFTPLCVSVDGMLGSEAMFFVKRMSGFLAAKWERPYSVVSEWVRARLSLAILKAALLCVRGSRTKWRSLRIIYGTSLPIVTTDQLLCVCLLVSVLFGSVTCYYNNNYTTKY